MGLMANQILQRKKVNKCENIAIETIPMKYAEKKLNKY